MDSPVWSWGSGSIPSGPQALPASGAAVLRPKAAAAAPLSWPRAIGRGEGRGNVARPIARRMMEVLSPTKKGKNGCGVWGGMSSLMTHCDFVMLRSEWHVELNMRHRQMCFE